VLPSNRPSSQRITFEQLAVATRVRQIFQFSPDVLLEAVRAGALAKLNCSDLDPPTYPGFTQWARTHRALREGLIPQGWELNDDRNYSRIVSADGTLALAVLTGDANTAVVGGEDPKSRACKAGPCSVEAVESNQIKQQLSFFPEMPEGAPISIRIKSEATTWILLVRYDKLTGVAHAELSLPIGFDDTKHISEWQERIVLPHQLIGGPDFDEIDLSPEPDQPDIDFNIQRK